MTKCPVTWPPRWSTWPAPSARRSRRSTLTVREYQGNQHVHRPVGVRRVRSDAAARRASARPVSYTHLRAHETVLDLVCRLLLEKKKQKTQKKNTNKTHST